MLLSRKAYIKRLLQKKESCKWEEAELHHSEMDPDVKAHYLNDIQFTEYMIDREIEELEFRERMLPLRWMLLGFIIFATAMFVYMVLS
jgi:hypothetical protein